MYGKPSPYHTYWTWLLGYVAANLFSFGYSGLDAAQSMWNFGAGMAQDGSNWNTPNELARISCFGWAAWCIFDTLSCILRLRELRTIEQRVRGLGGEWGC